MSVDGERWGKDGRLAFRLGEGVGVKLKQETGFDERFKSGGTTTEAFLIGFSLQKELISKAIR